jgi:cbb3-type cytochrome oxidase maturation protein
MNILSIVIVVALLLTIIVLGAGIWSMAHGGEFDEKHSEQFMFARIGLQAVTLALLFIAIYLANT